MLCLRLLHFTKKTTSPKGRSVVIVKSITGGLAPVGYIRKAGLTRRSASSRGPPTRAAPWLHVPGPFASRPGLTRANSPVLTWLHAPRYPVCPDPRPHRAPLPGSPLAPPSQNPPSTTYRDTRRVTRLSLPRCPPFRAPPAYPLSLSPGCPRHELPSGYPVPGSHGIPRPELTRGPPSRSTRCSAVPGYAVAVRSRATPLHRLP